jgi:AraC-like DNA-binding protein
MSDPFSAVLELIEARSVLSTGLVAGGAWSVAVDAHQGMKFNAVARGEAWLHIDGDAPVRVGAGDCFMLCRGRPFILASDLALPARAAKDVFAGAVDGVARAGDGDAFYVVAGRMELDAALAHLLTDALPAVIVLRAGGKRAQIVQWLVARLVAELEQRLPGGDVQARQLMHMMFVELMREHLETASPQATGWFGALADGGLRLALQAMHAAPSHPWTLPELAARAHMSRSGFAARFKTMVGMAPLAYLARWRLHLATRALRAGRTPLADIAAAAGYASESAFGNAFKRIMGKSPTRYTASR